MKGTHSDQKYTQLFEHKMNNPGIDIASNIWTVNTDHHLTAAVQCNSIPMWKGVNAPGELGSLESDKYDCQNTCFRHKDKGQVHNC
jgi:hypothetical protein